MKHYIIISLLLLTCAFGGCSQKGENFSLDKSFKTIVVGPSPKQLVDQAFYSPDPDRQREAIDELTKHDYGLKEPYLKGYASLLQYQLKLKTEDRHPTLLSSAIRALGKAGDVKYVPDVISAADDQDAAVRTDVAAALDNLNSDESFKTLTQLAISDSDTHVRVNACRALAGYKTQKSINTLIRAMDDYEFAVRYQAHKSLIKIFKKDMGENSCDWAGIQASQIPTTQPAKKPWWKLR